MVCFSKTCLYIILIFGSGLAKARPSRKTSIGSETNFGNTIPAWKIMTTRENLTPNAKAPRWTSGGYNYLKFFDILSQIGIKVTQGMIAKTSGRTIDGRGKKWLAK